MVLVVVVVVVVVGGNQIYRWDLNTGMERPSWAGHKKTCHNLDQTTTSGTA